MGRLRMSALMLEPPVTLMLRLDRILRRGIKPTEGGKAYSVVIRFCLFS